MTTKKTDAAKSDNVPSAQEAAKLTWLPKKTFELEITIPWGEVQKSYERIVEKAASEVEIKGFRKGKAPKAKVEEYLGKSRLYEEVIEDVVSAAYSEAVKKHNLHPVVNPRVTPVSLEENKDWVVKVTSCEFPEVKLGDYKGAIKGLKAKASIWTPDKAKEPEGEKKEPDRLKPEQVFEELLKTTEVEMSEILIENETNRLISELVDQAQSAGISLRQYLESKNMTQEQLRHQYQHMAEDNLKIEFILTRIAEAEKIELPIKEAEEMVAKSNDPMVKKAYENPNQKMYLAIMLRKQKTIDFLLSL